MCPLLEKLPHIAKGVSLGVALHGCLIETLLYDKLVTSSCKSITNYAESKWTQELVRTCISLPEGLLDRFDEITKKRGYSSRSEGIRDSIRHTVVHYEWMNEIDGKRLGVISFVYEHHQRGLVDNLARIQHKHAGLIISSYSHPPGPR